MDRVVHRGLRPRHVRSHALAPSRTAPVALLALGALLALAGCGRQDAATVAPLRATPPVSLADALGAMLRPSGPDAAEAFLRALATASTVRDVAVVNRHDPRWTDTVTTLAYDGLEITVYRVSSTGTRFPMAVRVTSSAYRAPDGLRLGMTPSQVRQLLGAPVVARPDALLYRRAEPGGAPYQLTVQLGGGRVTALLWSADLD